jgi:hypothetical protein
MNNVASRSRVKYGVVTDKICLHVFIILCAETDVVTALFLLATSALSLILPKKRLYTRRITKLHKWEFVNLYSGGIWIVLCKKEKIPIISPDCNQTLVVQPVA